MTRVFLRCLALLALVVPASGWAAITCNVASPGLNVAYVPSNPSPTVVQSSFTVTCSRSTLADPASVNFSVYADNGSYAAGNANRAAFGTNRMAYELYEDAACTQAWEGFNAITGTVTFSGMAGSATKNYWACVAAGLSPPAGTYTDNVTMSMLYSGLTLASGSLSVAIATPATCALSTAPGNVVFNYVAFGGAQTPSTTFRVTCTSYLPYTMALDATSGTALGLSYTLSLSATGGTGTGAAQTYSINGSMAAGQAGTCASGTCSATQARTLTITY